MMKMNKTTRTRSDVFTWFKSQLWFWKFVRNFYVLGRNQIDIESYIYSLDIKKGDLFIKAFSFIGTPEGVKFWAKASTEYRKFLENDTQ